jgi:hypothetical protein
VAKSEFDFKDVGKRPTRSSYGETAVDFDFPGEPTYGRCGETAASRILRLAEDWSYKDRRSGKRNAAASTPLQIKFAFADKFGLR